MNRVCAGCWWELLAPGHMCTTQHFIISMVTWRGHAGRGAPLSLTQPVGLLLLLTHKLTMFPTMRRHLVHLPAVSYTCTGKQTHMKTTSGGLPAVVLRQTQVQSPCQGLTAAELRRIGEVSSTETQGRSEDRILVVVGFSNLKSASFYCATEKKNPL